MSPQPAIDAADVGVLACIGLGANLGDPVATLEAALAALACAPGCVLQAYSSLYRSAPVDADGPDFINAVALLRTRLAPVECWHLLQAIEAAHHRERPYRNAPRTLDLDLLLWGDQCVSLPALQVPHPRLHLRAFVLRPLAELLPDVVVPGRGRVQDLMAAAGVAEQAIERYSPPPR